MNRRSNYCGVSHVDNELQQNGWVRSEPVDVVLHEMTAAVAGARHLLNEIAVVNPFLVTHNNVIHQTIPTLNHSSRTMSMACFSWTLGNSVADVFFSESFSTFNAPFISLLGPSLRHCTHCIKRKLHSLMFIETSSKSKLYVYWQFSL